MAPQHLRDKLLAPLDRTLGRTLETPLLSATCAALPGFGPLLMARACPGRTPRWMAALNGDRELLTRVLKSSSGRLVVGGAVTFQLVPGLLYCGTHRAC